MANLTDAEGKSELDCSLMADSLAVALTQVGVQEIPPDSNRGPQVEEYLRAVGLGPGNSYCAAFAFWCIQRAWRARSPDADTPFVKTGWTPSIWAWAQKKGAQYWASPTDVHLGREIPDGALFLLFGKVGNVERVNHVGFVKHLDVEKQVVYTVEGNTNPAGSREGGGVYARERKLAGIYRFVMYGF